MEQIYIVVETTDSDGVNVTAHAHKTLESAKLHLAALRKETVQMLNDYPVGFDFFTDNEKEYVIEDYDGDWFTAVIQEKELNN